jgi:predicted PurR-regulated permease PerM
MTTDNQHSPYWTTTTKLIIGLTLVAISAGVFLYYRSIVFLMILASIITYLFQPIVNWLAEKTRMSWRLSTTLVFLVLIIFLIGLLTGAGLAIAQQITGLVRVIQEFVNDLPEIANNISDFLAQYGSISELIPLNDLANRLLETIQPLLGQAGSLVGSIATGAAISIGRIFLLLFIAYFLLSESQRVGEIKVRIPQYDYDVQRMSLKLRNIWDSYFRGQIIIFVMVFTAYLIILSALGVRYSIALAGLAGLAIFVPYVGMWTTSIVTVLVTFFQPSNYFGLVPWQYAILVLGIALLINFTFDNFISPRFLGRSLDIHPAAILIAALLMANLFGLVGIIVAAPSVATLKAVGQYVFRKMFDQDPWPETEVVSKPVEFPWLRWSRQLRSRITNLRSRGKDDPQNKKPAD